MNILNNKIFKTMWRFLAIYGVWFAILSGLEELLSGKIWKVLVSLLFSLAIVKTFKLGSDE